MKKSKLGLLLLSSLALVAGGAATGTSFNFYSKGQPIVVHAAEEVAYTLNCPKKASNSAYSSYYDITVNSVKWTVPGNQYEDGGWRIGGKLSSATKRYLYTQTSIDADVTSISITYGVESASIKVNSSRLDVYSTAELAKVEGDGDVFTISSIYSSPSTSFKITKPDDSDWSGRFFRFTYELSSSAASKNNYITLSSIIFNKEKVVTEGNSIIAFDSNGGTCSIANQEVKTGGTLDTIPTPTRDGFTFVGLYFDDDTFEDKLDSTSIISEDVTVYAKWIDNITEISKIYESGDTSKGEVYRVYGEVTSIQNNSVFTIYDLTQSIKVYGAGIAKNLKIGNEVYVTGTYYEKDGDKELYLPKDLVIDNDSTKLDLVTPLTSPSDVKEDNKYAYVELKGLTLGSDLSEKSVSLVNEDFILFWSNADYLSGDKTATKGCVVNVTGVVYVYNNTLEVLINTVEDVTASAKISEGISDTYKTKASLAFNYNYDGDSKSYTYSAAVSKTLTEGYVAMRFGGLIPFEDWNLYHDKVVEYGVMLAKTADLDEFSISEVYNEEDYADVIGTVSHASSSDMSFVKSDMATVTSDDSEKAYGLFNAYLPVPIAEVSTEITAAAYLKTNSSMLFFGETAWSVKSLAQEYVENYSSTLSDSVLGALQNLAK